LIHQSFNELIEILHLFATEIFFLKERLKNCNQEGGQYNI
jgi:hypothetical protein